MVEKEPQLNNEGALEPGGDGGGKEVGAVDVVREKTKEILEGLSDSHGWEHTVLVADYAKLLAVGEGRKEVDVANAEMAGLTHDWGRALEKSDLEHRSHAVLSREASRDVYRELWEQGKITAPQYGEIQRAIGRHSLFGETPRETLKIVRDADRLSRFGSLGLQHTILYWVEEGTPFYIKGHPIIQPVDAPGLKLKDVKCAIDALNFCLEFEKTFETESASKICDKLKKTNRAFLELFSAHQDLNDGRLWLDFLQKPAIEFKRRKEEFARNFSWTGDKGDLEKWLMFYEKVEGPEIFTEEKFQDFLKQYKG